jgi:hypothetical protein
MICTRAVKMAAAYTGFSDKEKLSTIIQNCFAVLMQYDLDNPALAEHLELTLSLYQIIANQHMQLLHRADDAARSFLLRRGDDDLNVLVDCWYKIVPKIESKLYKGEV